jgi:HTH-type transcriptional regulator/antitoxin HigA
MEEMALTTSRKKAYAKLLTRVLPTVIQDEAENERVLAELERLDSCGRRLTPEEESLAELLTLLVRQYEQAQYPLGHADPVEALRVMMEQRGLRQRDLIPIFGSSSTASDVVNGKRSISKTQARKLADFFHVPVSLFV